MPAVLCHFVYPMSSMYFGNDTETCWLPLPGVRARGSQISHNAPGHVSSILGSFIHMLAVSFFGKDVQNVWCILSGFCARGREISQMGVNVCHVGTRSNNHVNHTRK